MKQLADFRSVQSNTELPIYEEWQVANDSLLNGIWYRIAEDTNYLPEANIKLYYRNNKITLEYVYTGKHNQAPEIFTFKLKSIDPGVYTFTNLADTLSGEARKQLKEIFLITIAYDCSKKRSNHRTKTIYRPKYRIADNPLCFQKRLGKKRVSILRIDTPPYS